MNAAGPRLLFVPVSGPSGMGEYGRALAMAHAIKARVPQASVQFVLSREAPYAAEAPFPATLLSSSPTFHSPEVAALIREFQPHVVIFDNAGRTAQLRAAHCSGARVVFVSARARQRRKAFRLRWMRLIDEHWIAYPQLLAGAPGFLERMKLGVFGRPRMRFLDPVLPGPDAAVAAGVLARFGLRSNEYVAVVPGGGTEHPGMGAALRAIAGAASRLAQGGIRTVLVGLEATEDDGSEPLLHRSPRMPVPELVELLRNARMVVTNGGYTLLQALACHRPCLAVPLAKDQSTRVDRCVAAGLALRGEADAAALERAVVDASGDFARLEAMRLARERAGITNGARTVADALADLASRMPGSGR